MAIQNPRELHNGQVTESMTEPPRADGQPNTHHQIIKRKKLLYIILYYYGEGAGGKIQFRNAGAFKANRIKAGGSFNAFETETLKNVEVKTYPFYKIKDFQDTWTKIHELASQDNYTLQEVHIFGHGGHDVLYLKSENFTYELIKGLKQLPFSKTGALVLHTCRGGRYEDNPRNKQNKSISKLCLARTFSEHLNVKTIGQMTYSLFNPVTSLDGVKYYDMEISRRGLSIVVPNVVLWAYRIGNAVKSKHGQEPDYKILAHGQLFPARIFYPVGRAVYNVGKDMFNNDDLKYI